MKIGVILFKALNLNGTNIVDQGWNYTNNLQTHKNHVDQRESENNLGYGFLISPHKDVYLIEEYQLATYRGSDTRYRLLYYGKVLNNPKWIPCISTSLETSWCTTRHCAYWYYESSRKTYMDSNIPTYKARLLTERYRYRHCVDYDSTFYLLPR